MHALAGGLSYFDLEFLGRPRVIAVAVAQGADGVALVDPGPSTCLPRLRAELAAAGITAADVRTVLLTHIHLDHAGVAGTLVRENPAIEVYVHERGAPHMVDPTRLLSSAERLYGADMDRLWGEFLPVPEQSIRVLRGGEQVEAGGRRFEVAYTPGHASHHVSYFDPGSGVALVGDTAGVRTGQALFVMPPTPPPDIDVEAWMESIERIRRWRPATLLATHFGPHEDTAAHLDAFLQHLAALAELARGLLAEAGSDAERLRRFVGESRVYLQRHLPADEVDLYDFAAPLKLGWLGLQRYWRKRGADG